MSDLRKAASSLLETVIAAIQAGDWKVDGACDPHVEIIRLKNILARPEQESVKESFNSKTSVKEAFTLDRGCWERGCVAYDERDGDAVNISAERVDETAKRGHEPFIYVREDNERPFGGYEHCSEADAGAFPVYTAPPKREWVGLTDEEMRTLKQKSVDGGMTRIVSDFEYIRSIEAKLKEKNNG